MMFSFIVYAFEEALNNFPTPSYTISSLVILRGGKQSCKEAATKRMYHNKRVSDRHPL